MKLLRIAIPVGLGDLIYTKAMMDNIKHQYDQIQIKIYRDIVPFYNISLDYNKFLDDIGKLFFGEPPYVLISEEVPFHGLVTVCNDNNITPIKPELKNLLCKGNVLDVGEEYIAIVTKVRYMTRDHFNEKKTELFDTLRELSRKYKIVVLGEREVELNAGYLEFSKSVYSIYEDVVQNIPQDRLIDLSVPALGITAPSLSNIQQDCLTMSNSKFVVTMGIGGGFCMATAVANTIGYRTDQDPIGDVIFNKEYSNASVTKDWGYFINKLRQYL